MLRYILMDTFTFASGEERAEGERSIMWVLEALCQRNQSYLRANPRTPHLYKSGVKWSAPKQLSGDVDEVKILREALGSAARRGDVRRVLDKVQEVFGGEHFCDIGRIYEMGEIDCDGLACARVAELRQAGIQAKPFMTSRERDGGTTYHALVIWPPLGPCNYETSEDPSLLLGMYQPQRAADRAEEIRKNVERSDILRKYGRAALRPAVSTPSFTSSYEGAALDAAVSDLLGTKRKATR